MQLTKYDARLHGTRRYLTPTDEVFFFCEYVRGAGFQGRTNSLISNLKKSLDKPDIELNYKVQAISKCAALLARDVGAWDGVTFVPVPPSLAKSDPMHDDRLVRVLREARLPDVRELVVASHSRRPAHASPGNRPAPSELLSSWGVDWTLAHPRPRAFVVFDDVLVEGTHFRAMTTLLQSEFPGLPCFGLYIARCIWP